MTSILIPRSHVPAHLRPKPTHFYPRYPTTRVQRRSIFNSLPNSLLTNALGTPALRHLSHTRLLPYPAGVIFHTISDVAAYPKFLPFTESSQVTAQDERGYPTRAQLKVGYAKFDLQEVWDSVVRCDPHAGVIEAKSSEANSDGLFEVLKTKWRIQAHEGSAADTQTSVQLDVDVQFRNPIYDQMFAQFEAQVASTMIAAFERRVAELEQSPRAPQS